MLSAILDACVLYPAPLRDFFMRLAVSLYQPKWTDDIHEEWIRNVLDDRPDLSAVIDQSCTRPSFSSASPAAKDVAVSLRPTRLSCVVTPSTRLLKLLGLTKFVA